MTNLKRVRGLRALVEDAVEHGSRAVERVHLATAGRTFAVLELLPVIAEPARLVHAVYDAGTGATYAGVRLVNRAVGVVADLVIDAVEASALKPPDSVAAAAPEPPDSVAAAAPEPPDSVAAAAPGPPASKGEPTAT